MSLIKRVLSYFYGEVTDCRYCIDTRAEMYVLRVALNTHKMNTEGDFKSIIQQIVSHKHDIESIKAELLKKNKVELIKIVSKNNGK